jgi:hypothetical protein
MTENINERQVEAAKLLEGALRGDRNDRIKLQEGIATSDLPVQLAPVINKILFQNYQEIPKIWDQFATRIVVDDFRKQEYLNLRYEDEGLDNQGDEFREGSLPTVGEYDEYPTAGFFSVTETDFAVKKAGQRVRFSWEAVVNDNNISVLERLPIELAQKAAGKEDEEVTKQLVTASGINTANFNSGNNNLFAGNGALTLENLEKAVEAANLQQYNGKLIQPVTQFALVIPRALEMTARRIFSIQEIRTQNGTGAGSTVTITGNPLNASTFNIVVNDWLTKINGGSGSYWFLIPVPSATLNPSVVLGFLRGFEAPELRVKRASGAFLGGGDVPEAYGSFENDDWQMRVRHIATGGFFIPAGTIVSTGAGS